MQGFLVTKVKELLEIKLLTKLYWNFILDAYLRELFKAYASWCVNINGKDFNTSLETAVASCYMLSKKFSRFWARTYCL
jgi:hypothetical protein